MFWTYIFCACCLAIFITMRERKYGRTLSKRLTLDIASEIIHIVVFIVFLLKNLGNTLLQLFLMGARIPMLLAYDIVVFVAEWVFFRPFKHLPLTACIGLGLVSNYYVLFKAVGATGRVPDWVQLYLVVTAWVFIENLGCYEVIKRWGKSAWMKAAGALVLVFLCADFFVTYGYYSQTADLKQEMRQISLEITQMVHGGKSRVPPPAPPRTRDRQREDIRDLDTAVQSILDAPARKATGLRDYLSEKMPNIFFPLFSVVGPIFLGFLATMWRDIAINSREDVKKFFATKLLVTSEFQAALAKWHDDNVDGGGNKLGSFGLSLLAFAVFPYFLTNLIFGRADAG